MRYLFFLLNGLLSVLLPTGLAAQVQRAAQPLVPAPGISSNSVTSLHAEGDALWVGPRLDVTRDGGQTWFGADIDSVRLGRLRLYSLDVEGDDVWGGLGYTLVLDEDNVVGAAGGFAHSGNGGATFTLLAPPLDEPGDTTELYGISLIPAEPIDARGNAQPWGIDFDPLTGTLWSANYLAGIRRSDDGGQTWQRVVLPPDDLDEITPSTLYNFALAPKRSPASPRGNFNHVGYSVLVDEEGTVWAGTLRGVNVSRDGGVSWRRYSYTGGPNGLTGPWVTALREQRLDGQNAVWMASWAFSDAAAGGRYGVTVTRDGGQTFTQALAGELIYDFAFRGATVFAAGQSGLFISQDGGQTWRVERAFFDPAHPRETVRPDVEAYAAAVTDDGALWVGTDDGLFKSMDEGATFTRFRAEIGPRPAQPTARTPRVDAYAYPNPFSPEADRFVRVCFALGADGERCARDVAGLRIRLFDFGMNLVRTLDEPIWDGRDADGYRVPNGTYFYAIDAGGETLRGKILVLE